jgi:hypothetical protein
MLNENPQLRLKKFQAYARTRNDDHSSSPYTWEQNELYEWYQNKIRGPADELARVKDGNFNSQAEMSRSFIERGIHDYRIAGWLKRYEQEEPKSPEDKPERKPIYEPTVAWVDRATGEFKWEIPSELRGKYIYTELLMQRFRCRRIT